MASEKTGQRRALQPADVSLANARPLPPPPQVAVPAPAPLAPVALPPLPLPLPPVQEPISAENAIPAPPGMGLSINAHGVPSRRARALNFHGVPMREVWSSITFKPDPAKPARNARAAGQLFEANAGTEALTTGPDGAQAGIAKVQEVRAVSLGFDFTDMGPEPTPGRRAAPRPAPALGMHPGGFAAPKPR